MSVACIFALPIIVQASCIADLPYICHAASAGGQFECSNGTFVTTNLVTEGDIKWASIVNGNGYDHNDYFNTTCDWQKKTQHCWSYLWTVDENHQDPVSESYADGNHCGEW